MTLKEREIKRAVKEGYASIAKQATSYYSSRGCSCCGNPGIPEEVSRRMGYSEEEISAAPPESNLGLGAAIPWPWHRSSQERWSWIWERGRDLTASWHPLASAPPGWSLAWI